MHWVFVPTLVGLGAYVLSFKVSCAKVGVTFPTGSTSMSQVITAQGVISPLSVKQFALVYIVK